jgi:poly(A) polymerase Pap1
MIILGIATLNYAMKEFCIIALVGLICDFFLQLVFFPTVLAIDLRRLEVSSKRRGIVIYLVLGLPFVKAMTSSLLFIA